jgi:hypothetical protein
MAFFCLVGVASGDASSNGNTPSIAFSTRAAAENAKGFLAPLASHPATPRRMAIRHPWPVGCP